MINRPLLVLSLTTLLRPCRVLIPCSNPLKLCELPILSLAIMTPGDLSLLLTVGRRLWERLQYLGWELWGVAILQSRRICTSHCRSVYTSWEEVNHRPLVSLEASVSLTASLPHARAPSLTCSAAEGSGVGREGHNTHKWDLGGKVKPQAIYSLVPSFPPLERRE